MGIRLKWLPSKCAYCENPIACVVSKYGFLSYTSVTVCEDCAKDIWEEETKRRLP